MLGITGVRATELVHEVGDDAVEVKAIVEPSLRQINKVVGGDGHILREQLHGEVAQGGLEGSVDGHGGENGDGDGAEGRISRKTHHLCRATIGGRTRQGMATNTHTGNDKTKPR